MRQEHRELFPAIAEGEIGTPAALEEHRGQASQNPVARWMPVAVVDRFEVVNIKHEQRQARAVTPGGVEIALEPDVEETPIAQSGQLVAQ